MITVMNAEQLAREEALYGMEEIDKDSPDQGREHETVCAQCGTVTWINVQGYCGDCARIIQSYVDFMREKQGQAIADQAQYDASYEEAEIAESNVLVEQIEL